MPLSRRLPPGLAGRIGGSVSGICRRGQILWKAEGPIVRPDNQPGPHVPHPVGMSRIIVNFQPLSSPRPIDTTVILGRMSVLKALLLRPPPYELRVPEPVPRAC